MNLSGKAVRYWLEKENVPIENCLIITDDLNLPFGTLRMKKKGSDGGHNGLKNIQSELNTTDYPRLRFGISADFAKGAQIDYVLGKWSIFMFYPADFTFVCPTELEDLEDHHEELKKLGFDVYSVSTDTHFTHKAWHDHSEAIKKVTYTMIGDPTAAVSRIFEVLNEESGLAYRGTFIVNPEGKIVAYEVNDEGIGRDASELVRRAKAAKFVADNPGLVCPAKWKEGEATLKPGLDLVGKI